MINVGFTFREWYFEGFESVSEYQSSNRPGNRVFASNRVTPTPQPSQPEQPRTEPGLDPRINTPTNPYAPMNNTNVDPSGRLYGP